MTFQKMLLGTASLIVLAFATAVPAQGDPLFFSNVKALQDNGNTQVDLFSNPNVTIFANPKINFLVDVSGLLALGTTNTLKLTYTEVGSAPVVRSYLVPLFSTVDPPFTLLFSFASPGATTAGTTATLSVDILGSLPDFVIPSGQNAGARVDSYTYSFRVAPVPEPASILLFGTALLGIAGRLRLRK